jgi:hypothetical protein
MDKGSFAANGVKHCVRPCDMMGKSAAIILRQIREENIRECENLTPPQKETALPDMMDSLKINSPLSSS